MVKQLTMPGEKRRLLVRPTDHGHHRVHVDMDVIVVAASQAHLARHLFLSASTALTKALRSSVVREAWFLRHPMIKLRQIVAANCFYPGQSETDQSADG